MVSNIKDLTGIESLFFGKGDQQISPQILEMLGKVISENLKLNQSQEKEINYFELYKSVETDFEKWIFSKFSKNYARDINNTAKKIFLRSVKSLRDICNLIEDNYVNKKSGTISFRVFLNFLEEKELLDEVEILKARKKIKIFNYKSNMDIYVPTTKEIKKSLEILNSGEYPREAIYLYQFMLESGCRFTEIEYFFKNFKDNNINENDEVISYKNFYLRGKKSSYFLFSSKKTFENLKSILDIISIETLNYIKRKIHRDKRIVCLKYLRKYNFTKLVQAEIDIELANFIQGRASQNVGVNHYLAKETLTIPKYSSFIKKFCSELY